MGKKVLKPPAALRKAAPAPAPKASAAARERTPDAATTPEAHSGRSTRRGDHKDSSKRQERTTKASGERQTVDSVKVQVTSPLLAKQLVNEVRVPPSMMQRLGIFPGALVGLTSSYQVDGAADASSPTSDHVVYLEALVGSSGEAVAVHPLVASQLVSRTAVLTVAEHHPQLPITTVEIVRDATADAVDDMMAAACFFKTFRWRTICTAMVVPVSVATVTAHFTVSNILLAADAQSAAPFPAVVGRVTDTTRVRVICRASPDSAVALGKHQPPVSTPAEEELSGSLMMINFSLLPSQRVELPRGQNVLFVGSVGSGKTHAVDVFLSTIGARNEATTVRVTASSLTTAAGETGTSIALRKAFAQAAARTPSVLVFDDLDYLLGSQTEASPWAQQQLVAAFVDELERIRAMSLDVVTVSTATSQAALPARLTASGRLGWTVEIESPTDAADRLHVLRALAQRSGLEFDDDLEHALSTIATSAHGFSPLDLHAILQWAPIVAYEKCNTQERSVSSDHLLEASRRVSPSAIKAFEVSVPTVRWSDIGGSDEAKAVIMDCVSWCLGKDKAIFERFGLSPPKGILLYGPPGCSKTMLAKALACESGLNFVSVKGPEVFSKWVGDSEKAVRDIFHRARLAAPCVVFIDELDGMCGHRGSGGVGDRVISQFLTELDGLPSAMTKKTESIVFVAATNRPDNIDSAVLRPGRIDRKVHVGLPCTEERIAIAKIAFREVPVAADVTPEYIASLTEGFTGAEVVALCKEAAFDAVRKDVNAEAVMKENVTAACAKVQPRISPSEVEWYYQWSKKRK